MSAPGSAPNTRRAALGWVLLAGASLGLPARAGAQAAAAGEVRATALPPLGSRLELPTVSLLDGGRFGPEQAQGRVLVLYWWASWCPFCALQSPLMEKLWQAQRGRGMLMLGLSIDKTAADARAHRQAKGYTFASAWVSPDVAKALPKPKGLPVTYVCGRDARLLMAEAGQLFAEDIEEIARFL
jgi:thiol-disulfide isomerase/thioredoxin